MDAAPRYVSLCSGGGGFDLGFEQAGWQPAVFCENDRHATAVLRHRWPDVPVLPDITKVTADDLRDVGPVRCVIGGTPCTDLSVAGRREGLAGSESRLFWDFCRVADHLAPAWVCWENVPGALSSNDGADFAAVLWGLTGTWPDLPADGWRSIGVCIGPKRAAVWRVLDARWFGVAQRRRRVFVVAGPPTMVGAALEVLLEPESSPRGARPGQPSGPSVTGSPRGCPVDGGIPDVAGTLGAKQLGAGSPDDLDRMTFVPVSALTRALGSGGADDTRAQAGWLVADEVPGPVTAKMAKGTSGPSGDEHHHLVFSKVHRAADDEDAETWDAADVAPTVNAFEGHNDERAVVLAVTELAPTLRSRIYSNPTTEASMLVVEPPQTFDWQAGGTSDHTWAGKSRQWVEDPPDGPVRTLRSTVTPAVHQPVVQAVAFNQRNEARLSDTAYALQGAPGVDEQLAIQPISQEIRTPDEFRALLDGIRRAATGFHLTQDPISTDELMPAISAGSTGNGVMAESVVRRLTPVECERLQGWPDDHTAHGVDADGRSYQVTDSARYRIVGNGVAAPCAAWIARRLHATIHQYS